jgi:hypothetical protein
MLPTFGSQAVGTQVLAVGTHQVLAVGTQQVLQQQTKLGWQGHEVASC